MKTSLAPLADRPRLVCRVVQSWVSCVGDGTAPQAGALGARHVASCPRCGEFFARAEKLGVELRSAAAATREAAAPELERDIMGAVRRATQPARRPASWRAGGVLAWGGVAAVVLVAVVVLQRQKGPSFAGPRPVTTKLVGAGRAEAVDADAVWSRLQPEATALLEGEPLQREVDAFYADARSALGFLALNFLPSSGDAAIGADAATPAGRPAKG